MNYQTVRLVSTFGSGSCVFSFGSSPKVETATVSSFGLTQKWKLWTRFQFWAISILDLHNHDPRLIPSKVNASQLSEVWCSEERSRYLKLQLFFKVLITQGSILPVYPIDNERYLGINTIIGSLMKTQGIDTNISFTFNHTL